MPPRKKQYDENLPVIDDPLPALEPESVDIPGADARFYQDLYNDMDQGVPQEVAEDVSNLPSEEAPSAIPETGMRFDFGSLNVQTKEDFAALPEEQKELLRAMKRGVQFTEESAAKFVLGQRERQQKLADASQSPANQREQRITEKEDKLAKETMIRQQQVLDKIDRYTNPENPNYVNIADLVGPWDGTAGGMIDATIGSKEKATMRAELERLVNNDVLELTKFLRPISQDELKFLKTMTPRMYQNENIWRSYLQDTKQRLLGDAVRPAQSQPNLYEQAKQNPATQLRQQFEQSDELTLPNGQKLKRVVDQNGNIGWEPQ